MEIELRHIKVKEILKGFVDNDDDGVFAYDGKLAIRPPYQREFVYDLEKSESVLQTVLKKFPLNIMYWVLTNGDSFNSEDAKFEVLDGQQRTLSIMKYLTHKFAIDYNGKKYYWDSLPDDVLNTIYEYELMIYICKGTTSEKLDWFRVVNIGGEKLSDQELRNSVYTGEWLTDAKKYFSKRTCAAKRLSDKYITGDPNRQELLEKALKGICENKHIKDITTYMSDHQKDINALELWKYFENVIDWIEYVFPKYFSDMKGLDWLHLYNKYSSYSYDGIKNVEEIKKLHSDDDVQKFSGIYEFLLAKDFDPYAGRFLNLRAFDERDKRAAYNKQKGVCPVCKKHFEYDEMEGDHKKPWSKGGHTVPENCQMLCRECNEKKSNKY